MRTVKRPAIAAALIAAGLLFGTAASAADNDPSVARQAGEAARGAWDTTKETARNAWQFTRDTARQAWTGGKETAKEAWDTTKEKTGEATRDVKEGWQDGKK